MVVNAPLLTDRRNPRPSSAILRRSNMSAIAPAGKRHQLAEAYIIDAVRTPRGLIGKPGKGALSHLHPQHLAATVLKAILERNNLDTATVDDVIWSTSAQNGQAGRRHGPHGRACRRL
jgi:hypothetical protein